MMSAGYKASAGAGPQASEFARSLRRLSLVGIAGMGLFASTVGVWALATTLSGAVVAPGQFVVTGNAKKVQHPTGGIVGELNVQEGDHVEQNAVLIRLDDTVTRANLQVVAKQLDELAARQARLQAERDGAPAVSVPPEFAGRASELDTARLVQSERSLFAARRTARDGQKAQLNQRIGQLADEIAGLASQQKARDRQAALIDGELQGVQELYAKNLVSLSRKTALEREAADLEGRKGQLIAAVAQAQGKIAETRLQIIQVDDAMREEVMKELREIQSRMAELSERRIAAEDQLKRIEIRAPNAGFVHQLAVHTVGGVITPAEPAMMIVPDGDSLQVEARINPPDIDQIAVGRPALVKVHSFNQRMTPELNGVVARVSPDTSRDQQTGANYYTVRVTVGPQEFARIAPHRITAGMQADIFVKTEDRTPFEFIVKPLRDQIAKSFRER